MRKTHRLTSRITIAPVSAGSTVGKMKLYRKVVKGEVVPFEAVQGVGRFEILPKLPVSRRI